ncbi:MAG: PaaI family thioesterase [Actinomycetota bacterium]|nr:MAG: PaaI family thioesterase [Actinomycetota bacterium]
MSNFELESFQPLSSESLKALSSFGLLGAMGINLTSFDGEHLFGEIELGREHQAPNGYLHAGVVVSLADTLCGIGCQAMLPEGALTFTTLELKANFFSTARTGTIYGVSQLVHGGRTTQVWDCRVTSGLTGKVMAAFRCTQLIVYAKASRD